MGVYSIVVLSFFSSGISVILILMCGIAVSSCPAMCGFSSFWLTVFCKRRSFTVLRYHSYALSCLTLACSRLQGGGGKLFSKKKCEKHLGAGERQGSGACTHFFNGLLWYISS